MLPSRANVPDSGLFFRFQVAGYRGGRSRTFSTLTAATMFPTTATTDPRDTGIGIGVITESWRLSTHPPVCFIHPGGLLETFT